MESVVASRLSLIVNALSNDFKMGMMVMLSMDDNAHSAEFNAYRHEAYRNAYLVGYFYPELDMPTLFNDTYDLVDAWVDGRQESIGIDIPTSNEMIALSE